MARDVQRGEATLLADFHVRAPCPGRPGEERARRSGVAVLASDEEGCVAEVVATVGAGAGVEERADDRGVTLVGRREDRRHAVVRARVDVRLRANERVDDVEVAAPRRDEQRRASLVRPHLDRGADGEEESRRRGGAVRCRVVQRCVPVAIERVHSRVQRRRQHARWADNSRGRSGEHVVFTRAARRARRGILRRLVARAIVRRIVSRHALQVVERERHRARERTNARN